MIRFIQKGRVSAGEAVGILLLDTSVPFIPGDVANASTYGYPVRFQKVEGFTVERAIGKDPLIYTELKKAALELAGQGVRAITGDCGFMAFHQKRLANELNIPVFLSSLLQLPFIQSIIGQDNKVGVVTASAASLDADLLHAVGVSDPGGIVKAGLEKSPAFYAFAIQETGSLDEEAVEKEVVDAAVEMVRSHPSIKAVLLECSLLPPYAAAVHRAVGLPVFDYITMIDLVFSAVVKKTYRGFI